VSKESLIMRQLAHAIDTLEKMVEFMADSERPNPDRLTMSWHWGSSTLGYQEMQRGIEAVALDMWPQMREEAIRRQGLEVERLRLELTEEQARASAATAEPTLL